MAEDNEDEEPQEIYGVNFYPPTQMNQFKKLNQDEREEMTQQVMKDQQCGICLSAVFCAEMICTCPFTCNIGWNQFWKNIYSRKKTRNPKQQTERFHPPLWTTEQANGPWSISNPHPLRNTIKFTGYGSMKDIWETFWDNARYIGKNKFIKER